MWRVFLERGCFFEEGQFFGVRKFFFGGGGFSLGRRGVLFGGDFLADIFFLFLGSFFVFMRRCFLLGAGWVCFFGGGFRDFNVSMIPRADIEGSKSNVAMNAWLPHASYPYGNLF